MARPAVLETDPVVWRDEALQYIENRARRVGTVTAEDLRKDLPAPHHPNQYGAVFLIASRRNLITSAGHRTSGTRSRRHGEHKIWQLHPDQLEGDTR